jgi:RNA recognition motif-containing protein
VVDSAKILVDKFTNRRRGVRSVEIQNREEGLRAIQDLDSKDLGGRSIKVHETHPKPLTARDGEIPPVTGRLYLQRENETGVFVFELRPRDFTGLATAWIWKSETS